MSCQLVLDHALRPGDVVQQVHHIHLEPLPRVVGEARGFVTRHAPPLPGETRDVLELLTSELVTNVVLHARTRLELGITVGADCILVVVHDLDLARPEQQPYEPREGGWGQGLVSSLAEASALELHPDGGKTAWFRLSRGLAPYVGDDVASRPAHRAGGAADRSSHA